MLIVYTAARSQIPQQDRESAQTLVNCRQLCRGISSELFDGNEVDITVRATEVTACPDLLAEMVLLVIEVVEQEVGGVYLLLLG